MSVLILRRFRPEPPLLLRRFGPDGRLAALAERGAPSALPVVIGPPGAGASGAIAATAGQIISGHRAVWINRTAQAFYASNADATALVAIGITLGAALSGDPVMVQTSGTVTEPSWNWASDATVWLSADGNLTQTIPVTGALVKIGTPVAADTLHIAPHVISTR